MGAHTSSTQITEPVPINDSIIIVQKLEEQEELDQQSNIKNVDLECSINKNLSLSPKTQTFLEPKTKIYLLRHEERTEDISFGSQLTVNGQHRSENIISPKLQLMNIKTIYSSPFIRTLQTIKPFCDKTGFKVNIEWSLVESIPLDPSIPDKFNDIIKLEYNSILEYSIPSNTSIIEFNDLKQRVRKFIQSIEHIVQSENILLVTHMPVINAILSCAGFKYIEMYTHHDPGTLLGINSANFY
jgi:2,3-bisphosphoglycerate-dependent phosphoglycerate mutase